MSHRLPTLLPALCLGLALSTPLYAEADRPVAGGTLAWFSGDELELVGAMRASLPHELKGGHVLFASLDARTNIRRSTGDLTFLVEDLDYIAEIGWRRPTSAGSFSLVAGQWGTEQVDDAGQRYVRYLGAASASRGYLTRDDGLQWSASAALAIDDNNIRADGVLRGALSFTVPSKHGFWSGSGFEILVEGLVDGSDLQADWRFGPHKSFGRREGIRWTLFAHYLDSENPLGLGASGLLAGLTIHDGERRSPRRRLAPDVDGSIGVGAGEERLAGRFKLRVLSPWIGGRALRAVAEVDGNVLTAEDTSELYYLYHLGVEASLGLRFVAGTYFYHRSNHRLAAPNDTVTSINVLELGLETRQWDQPGDRWAPDPGRSLDVRLRAGYLLDSGFGLERRWHLRGGIRWSFRSSRRGPGPFVLLEREEGDVERTMYAAGLAIDDGVELRVEYRKDDQHFGRDKDALLLMTHVGF